MPIIDFQQCSQPGPPLHPPGASPRGAFQLEDDRDGPEQSVWQQRQEEVAVQPPRSSRAPFSSREAGQALEANEGKSSRRPKPSPRGRSKDSPRLRSKDPLPAINETAVETTFREGAGLGLARGVGDFSDSNSDSRGWSRQLSKGSAASSQAASSQAPIPAEHPTPSEGGTSTSGCSTGSVPRSPVAGRGYFGSTLSWVATGSKSSSGRRHSKVSVLSSHASHASQQSARTAAHFMIHWFGAYQFEHDEQHDNYEMELANEMVSGRQLVRALTHDNFRRKSRPSMVNRQTLTRMASRISTRSGGPPRPATLVDRMSTTPRRQHASTNAFYEEEEVVEQTSSGRNARDLASAAFDQGGDFMFAAKTSGIYTQEELVTQHWPTYVFLEILVATAFWAVYKIMEGTDVAGLESIYPGQTLFIIHTGCKDHRLELWRWLSYQFTHTAASHIIINDVLLFLSGIPLEGFHGHWRTFVVFNLGVMGGALFQGTFAGHASGLAGMSAGVYSLIAMHWGDLALNWRQSKFRRLKLVFLILLVVMDLCTTLFLPAGEHQESVVSYFSHLGGFVIGLLMSILLVRNLKVRRIDRLAQIAAALLLVLATGGCGAWLSQWPPRSLFDDRGWCWVRQVNNFTVFGDRDWHCIGCKDDACVRRWSLDRSMTSVIPDWCTENGKWV